MDWKATPEELEQLKAEEAAPELHHKATPEEVAQIEKDSEYSPLKAAGMGAINQLGLAPIVGGAALAAKDVATPEYGLKDFLERYRERRDVLKGKFKEAEEQSPKAYLAGNVAAGLALPIPGAIAGKGAMTLGRALKGGAALGGIAGLAASPADLTKALEEPEQLETAAKDVATGAAFGAGAGAIGGALGKLLGKGPAVESAAKKEALKALGADSDIIAKEYGLQKGIAGAEQGYEKGIGEEALGIIKPFGGSEQVRQDVQPLLKKQASLVSDLRKEASNQISNKQIEFKDFDDEIQKIKNQFSQNLEGQLNGEEKINKLSKMLDKQKQLYDFSKNDITRLNDLKVSLEKGISDKMFAKNIVEAPEEVQAEIALSQMLKNRIESMAEQAQPGLGMQLRNSNLKLSNLMDVATTAVKGSVKDINKQAAEVGDYVALGFGLPTYLAKKAFEAQTGQSALSTLQRAKVLGLKNTANLLQNPAVKGTLQAGEVFTPLMGRTPTNLSGMSSESQKESTTPLIYSSSDLSQHSAKLAQSQDPKAQQVGQMLANIANRPDREKNAMMFSLLQNPAYRKYLREGEAK